MPTSSPGPPQGRAPLERRPDVATASHLPRPKCANRRATPDPAGFHA